MDPRTAFGSADDLALRLGETGYLADNALATVAWLALRLGRPLLMEGEPGTGKTALAESIAEATDLPLIRLQCYEGIDATQALYDWDFPRQILHVRALEAVAGAASNVEDVEESLFDERFLLARPVLRALRESPGGPPRRRDRPGRRRVRGVPARGALDVAGHHPRARHRLGRHPADRRAHLEPDPRAARRPQAALPLPLDRPPGHGARARHPPPSGARGVRCAGRAGRPGRPRHPRGRRAAQAARRRRDARLGPGPARARHAGTSTPRSRRPRSGWR